MVHRRFIVCACMLFIFSACQGESNPPADLNFETYRQKIPGNEIDFSMTAIQSANTQHGDFWMATTETTWDIYRLFQFQGIADTDGVTGPTTPYVPMDFGMGVDGYPAISMTHFAARQYCRWLSNRTGFFFRLPTEKEWEHACLAGEKTKWYFGDDPDELPKNAWFWENADDRYHQPGKFSNPFQLYDMHGNVSEWVHDGHEGEEWGRIAKGGSWEDDAEDTTAAARKISKPSWKMQDPQIPKSIWYLTNAQSIGFRVVRPRNPPPPEEWASWWNADVDAILKIHQAQMKGDR